MGSPKTKQLLNVLGVPCHDSHHRPTNNARVKSEGSVLIEDLRDGGYLHPQPKSDFSNNKKNLKTNKRRGEQAHPPSVVVTGEVPTEDFRTVVELNMMGI